MRVALLGTGIMGAGMARNLVAAGHEVTAWNRTRGRAEGLGARVAATPQEAVGGAEAVITMLADGPAVAAALDGVDLGDAVWAQMSTVGIDETAAFAEGRHRAIDERMPADFAELGTFVDAPVLGSRTQAEAGELTVLASGPHERLASVFGAVGRTVDLGPEPGAGTRMKLVLNHWVLALTEGVAETILLAEGLGVDPRRFLEIIDGGPMGPPYAKLKGTNMVERSYPPAFPLRLAHKDAGLMAAAAEAAGVDAPFARLVGERMAAAIERGHGDEDFSATVEAGR